MKLENTVKRTTKISEAKKYYACLRLAKRKKLKRKWFIACEKSSMRFIALHCSNRSKSELKMPNLKKYFSFGRNFNYATFYSLQISLNGAQKRAKCRKKLLSITSTRTQFAIPTTEMRANTCSTRKNMFNIPTNKAKEIIYNFIFYKKFKLVLDENQRGAESAKKNYLNHVNGQTETEIIWEKLPLIDHRKIIMFAPRSTERWRRRSTFGGNKVNKYERLRRERTAETIHCNPISIRKGELIQEQLRLEVLDICFEPICVATAWNYTRKKKHFHSCCGRCAPSQLTLLRMRPTSDVIQAIAIYRMFLLWHLSNRN